MADLGNFRIQILNETGAFVAVLSLLSSVEQIVYHRDLQASLYANLLREYLRLNEPKVPSLAGKDNSFLYALSDKLHPSSQEYAYIVQQVRALRVDRSQLHQPRAIAYATAEKEILVVDRENAIVATYNADGSRSKWLDLPAASIPVKENDEELLAPFAGMTSIHTCMSAYISIHGEHRDQLRLFISDPLSHRIAVFRMHPALEWIGWIGATTYGDQTLCSDGFLPGELRFPSYLAMYQPHSTGDTAELESAPLVSAQSLLVSDTGNHHVAVFDAISGRFQHRIGYGFGHQQGFLDSPQGIAIYANQWLFICDQRNHRIQVFDLDTQQFCRVFGSNVLLCFPTAIAIAQSLPTAPKCDFGPYRDAKVIIGDTGNHIIYVFRLNDNVSCPATGDEVLFVLDASLTPFPVPILASSIIVEPQSGYLLIADLNNKCVVIFRHDGTYLSTFGEHRFQQPTSIVLIMERNKSRDERDEDETIQVMVADALCHALCRFELTRKE